MARPKPATTLEELAEKTGIEEELFKRYSFLSNSHVAAISFMQFEFPPPGLYARRHGN
ncbi:hypothetical protein ACFL3H_07840 [Gemmatimonadota bacterium]